jgi:general secretion pathway protein D
VLANQSYALLPVASGDARDMATALGEALRAQQGGALAAQIRVVPMQRVNAVLVAAAQPRLIDSARRVFALVENARRRTVRSWHVFYLQNGRSNDIAYVLQQAFTPENVTANRPRPAGPRPASASAAGCRPGRAASAAAASAARAAPGAWGSAAAARRRRIGLGAGGLVGAGLGAGGGGASGLLAQAQGAGGAAGATAQPSAGGANPLLGGLGGGAGGGEAAPEAMRIIPNPQNNAVVVLATRQEADTVQAMLRRIDILPLQVRIDATIAEVTLNDNLRYGTQFLFGGGGIAAALTLAPGPQRLLGNPSPASCWATAAASSTRSTCCSKVTQVRVLSSPQLLVMDNEPARLQVGSLVPFLTQSAQSTLAAGAPVVSSVDYRETGVITEVIPRVSSGGLVTLDISQQVSDVDPNAPSFGINSPTFLERAVRSRIVVQDGQTIGLAG